MYLHIKSNVWFPHKAFYENINKHSWVTLVTICPINGTLTV